MGGERLAAQIRFLLEADKLKGVLRRTLLTDKSRRENSAEHSWHIALMALVLSEHARGPINLPRVMTMAVLHDLVEIDAGDTFCYDEAGNRDRPQRERKAAERIFGLLPADQAAELRAVWEEFEARRTPEARFAAGVDRLQPLLHNFATEGAAWREHGVTKEQVIERNRHMAEGSPELWEYARGLIEEAVRRGYLKKREA